jgi:hypothetical protein
MAKRERDPETGKFLSKEEIEQQNIDIENIDTQDDVAIFASAGPGTCNFRNLVITMDPAEKRTKENPGKKGKRIKFKDGRYETNNKEEIEFLLWKCDNPRIYSKIKCIQLPEKYKKKEVS